MSSPQWNEGASEPVKSAGTGDGARREMQAVYGRFSCRPRIEKGLSLSPRPWRRRRMLSGAWSLGGGIMSSWIKEGKSDFSGRRGCVGDWVTIFMGLLEVL